MNRSLRTCSLKPSTSTAEFSEHWASFFRLEAENAVVARSRDRATQPAAWAKNPSVGPSDTVERPCHNMWHNALSHFHELVGISFGARCPFSKSLSSSVAAIPYPGRTTIAQGFGKLTFSPKGADYASPGRQPREKPKESSEPQRGGLDSHPGYYLLVRGRALRGSAKLY